MSETVGAALDRAARLYASREAVVAGDLRWTYEELERRVSAFDAALDRLGLGTGDVVAVLSMNSAAHLVAWLAVPRSGRVLNDLNFRLSPAELEFILEDSGARVLLLDDAFLETGRAIASRCSCVEYIVPIVRGDAPEGSLSFEELSLGPGGPARTPAPDSVAGIFYTGGTTGRPKGVMLTHANLVANAKHVLIAFGYDEHDSYLHAAPMFHLADGASTLALTWVGGRHVVIPAFDPVAWLEAMSSERITRGLLVPTMVNMVVNHPQVGDYDLSAMRSLFYGGSPIPEEQLRRAMEALPCEFGQAYGMTEAAPVATLLSPEDHRSGITGGDLERGRLRSAGRAVVGVELEVRRADGSPANVGEPGEICIRGPNIMKGYWRREAETAAALDDERWYHSGDAGYLDQDGYLFVVDRVKDMIISGGENVYSAEVENVLASHPDVLECAVFGVPDEQWGERVHATIVLKPDSETDEDALIFHCRELIAGYKVPRSIDFRDEPLPKSGAGKILKRELRTPFWAEQARQI